MARLIITSENTHMKLMDERVSPEDLKSLSASERLLERLEWSVAEAHHVDKGSEWLA